MRPLCFMIAGLLLSLAACGKASQSSAPPPATTMVYSATASVGDFIDIDIDHSTNSFTWNNRSNGTSGTATFTIDPDDQRLIITDSEGNFTEGYEIPGYALVMRATKTGPMANVTCLVTALIRQTTTVASISGKDYNYMQFRTGGGGMEVGHISISEDGITAGGYYPTGVRDDNAFPSAADTEPMPFGEPDEATGALIVHDEAENSNAYIFSTSDGLFAIDLPNGAIVAMEEASEIIFDTAKAGTYRGLAFSKNNATYAGASEDPVEGVVSRMSISITDSGDATIYDADGNVFQAVTLTPIAEDDVLVDGLLTIAQGVNNDCPGLFVARVDVIASDDSTVTREIFISFTSDAILFCSYTPDAGGSYSYFYGVALNQISSVD